MTCKYWYDTIMVFLLLKIVESSGCKYSPLTWIRFLFTPAHVRLKNIALPILQYSSRISPNPLSIFLWKSLPIIAQYCAISRWAARSNSSCMLRSPLVALAHACTRRTAAPLPGTWSASCAPRPCAPDKGGKGGYEEKRKKISILYV